MGQNLTGQTIASTYEDLVQISGSSRNFLTDGTGSDITNLNVTASIAVTSSHAITASHAVQAETVYTQQTNANQDHYVAFVASTNAYEGLETDNQLVYNPNTNILTVTASLAQNATSASFATNAASADTAISASYALTASFASNVPVTASYAISASHANNADSSISASYALTATSASHALNADNAISASFATTALSASYAPDTTFPYTGSAQITGSLGVTGSVTIDPVSDTANALVVNGGRINFSAGAFADTVWFNVGNTSNTFSTTDKSPVMSVGAGIANNSAANGVAFGENHTISNSGFNTFIGGGNGNSITGANKAAIIAGTSNTVNNIDSAIIAGTSNVVNNDRSVVIGGTGLTTTRANEVVVPNLTVSGSIYAINDGGVNDAAINISPNATLSSVNAGHQANPGIVIGSRNQGAYNRAILLGFNNTSSFHANGFDNYVIGTSNVLGTGGNFTSYNFIAGVSNQFNTSGRSNIILGESHQSSGSLTVYPNYGALIGGLNNTLAHEYSVILGGTNRTTRQANTVYVSNFEASGSTTITGSFIQGAGGNTVSDPNSGMLAVGSGNSITATQAAIIAGVNNNTNNAGGGAMVATDGSTMNGGYGLMAGCLFSTQTGTGTVTLGGESHTNTSDDSAILAGRTHTMSGGVQDSAIIAGKNSVISAHTGSVILGGNGLATTKSDEVVVPRLTISGSFVDTVVIANYASINFADDTAAAAGGIPLGGVYRNGNFLMIRIV